MATVKRPASLFGNALFASLSAGSAVLLLALLIVAGRVLGDEDYGKFSFALALATLFETLIDFGLKEVAMRRVARDHGLARTIIAGTFGLKLVLAATTLVALVGTVTLLRDEPDVRLATYLLGGSSILRSYLFSVRHVLIGLERFDLESLIVIVDRLLLLGAGLAALLLETGVIGLGAGFLLARMVALGLAYLVAAREVGRFGPTFDLAFWRDLQVTALPFGAFVIVLYLYNYFDTVMLGVLRTDAETGLYNAAYRLYEGVSNVPAILQAVLMPRLARHFVTDRERHRSLARLARILAIALAVPAVALSLMFARPLVLLLFGADYDAAADVFRLLSAGLLFVFPLFVLHAEAISVDAERTLLRAAGLGCAVNIALNALLIPAHGMYGAAGATVIGELVSLGALLRGLRRHTAPPLRA